MREVSEQTLLKKFKEAFPKEYELLSLAKSQDEIDELHTRFVDEARENIKTSLKNVEVSADDDDGGYVKTPTPVDSTVLVVLTPDEHEDLVNARKGEIKNELHILMDVITRLRKLEKTQLGLAVAEMVVGGMLALSTVAAKAAFSEFFADVAGGEAAAVIAGVTAMTVVTLIAVVTFIIILILVPILIFMQKPANCVLALINDLDEKLYFEGDYSIHGKARLMNKRLLPATSVPGWGTYGTCALISATKSKNSLFGTQYGFTFKTRGGKHFSFGVENPLTSFYKNNNCFCEIDSNAKNVANQTDKHNKQESEDTKDGITIDIRCNSGHGSTAYYIARVYRKEK